TSAVSSSIVVNAQPATPAAPTAGTVTQPTCATATGSFQITGYSASNTYTFTPSVVSISGTGLVTANSGTYTFTQTNAAGCISLVSSDIVVNAQPATPSAPISGTVTQPTCSTATGSFQITGYTASNTYTFTPSVVSISGTGLVTANSGTYTFTQSNAAGCTSAVSSSIVVFNVICVNDDIFASIGGNVTTNDTLNGAAVTTSNTDVSAVTLGPLSIDTNGNLSVASNTPSGTYTITYELCEVGASPANCNTATATVVVNNPIDAVNDPSVTVASNNTVVTALNALANDTLSNSAATTTNTNVTPLTTGPLSIDADGIVTVAANTPSGTYSITYQLCEANPSTGLNVSPANCNTATATVVVNNPVDAVNDPSVTVASNNTIVTALNALANDTLSNIAVTTTNTNVTPLTTGPLSIDADGIVTVGANTASGTYSITYQLCEANPSSGLNMIPANCDNATATVVVFNPIDAVNDGPVTVASATTPTVILNVTDNDTLNTIAVTATNTDV
ncbi:hypothetical protein ACNQGK_15020, partial [Flavobacterium sp. GSP14]